MQHELLGTSPDLDLRSYSKIDLKGHQKYVPGSLDESTTTYAAHFISHLLLVQQFMLKQKVTQCLQIISFFHDFWSLQNILILMTSGHIILSWPERTKKKNIKAVWLSTNFIKRIFETFIKFLTRFNWKSFPGFIRKLPVQFCQTSQHSEKKNRLTFS